MSSVVEDYFSDHSRLFRLPSFLLLSYHYFLVHHGSTLNDEDSDGCSDRNASCDDVHNSDHPRSDRFYDDNVFLSGDGGAFCGHRLVQLPTINNC